MIHGQVAIAWSKALEIRYLVVANDAVAANKTMAASVRMAGPPSCKTSIQTVEECIKSLNDPRTHDLVVSIITTNIEDALTVCEGATSQVKRVNLGNYGRLNMQASTKDGIGSVRDKKKLSDNVYVTEEDIRIIRAIQALNIPVDVQLLPYTPMVTVDDALK